MNKGILDKALSDLRRMSDLVDAFRPTKEVIEAARAASEALDEYEERHAQREREAEQLDKQIVDAKGELQKVDQDLGDARARAAVEKAGLQAELEPLRQQVQEQRQALAELEADRQRLRQKIG